MSPIGDGRSHQFESVLHEVPSNYPHIKNVALDVPEHVSEGFGTRGHVPVEGSVDGVDLTATLVPAGGGRHRLFLNGEVRRKIGKGPGDSVTIEVRFDRSDRMPELPEDLAAALADGDAIQAWEALAPSRRKEFLVVLADSKRERTRAVGSIGSSQRRSTNARDASVDVASGWSERDHYRLHSGQWSASSLKESRHSSC